jgi:hypothetical protein
MHACMQPNDEKKGVELVEIDKTGLSIKLQHKMNSISNYFTK